MLRCEACVAITLTVSPDSRTVGSSCTSWAEVNWGVDCPVSMDK